MKLIYNRYKSKSGRLVIPIAKYKDIDGNEAVGEEPSLIKLLDVNKETTTIMAYNEFKDLIKEGKLTQIL